jgi:hypothetical protein
MLEALKASLGVVSTACESVGISRQTHYDWMKSDPTYRQSVDALADLGLDFAETHLFELIRSGNPSAIIFFLKTKGKRRGYVERLEAEIATHDRPTGQPIRWADEPE